MSTLNELNMLREAAGMKPLKSWKESKAKLDAAIKKLLKPTVNMEDITSGALPLKAGVAKPEATKEAPDNDKLASAAKASGAFAKTKKEVKTAKPETTKELIADIVKTEKAMNAQSKAMKKKEKAPEKKTAGEGVSISTIAKKLNINPKVARAKLRRAFGDADGTGKDGTRWEFTPKRIAEIEALLKGDARKK